jgi:hypothetical protein
MYDNPRDTPVNLDYAERSSNFVVRVGNGNANHIAFSFDGGATWLTSGAQPAGTNGGGTVAVAADASRLVWSPSGAAVSFSTNNGASWAASTDIPRGATVISDRVNPLKFYGFANGVFYISADGGANFTASAAAGLPGFVRFKAVPGREGDIWLAGGGGGLWRSVDGGATFTRLGNVEVADAIGFGKAAPRRGYPAIYALAQVDGIQGVFRSDDAGSSWVRINDDQHQFATAGATITGDPRVYGRVYIGTNGRGIIQGDSHGPNGGCTVTPVVYANTPWYNEQVVRLDNNGDVDITALSVTIRIQRTAGLNHSGQYNNVGGGQILQSHSGDATTLMYQFTLAPGQTLRPGRGFAFAAQTGGSGNHHPMDDDAYTVNYKAGGASFTQTGRF